MTGGWDGGWLSHRQAQLDEWCSATPARRLEWLEEAMAFAREAILGERRTGPPASRSTQAVEGEDEPPHLRDGGPHGLGVLP